MRFQKDVNSNQVNSSISARGSSVPSSHSSDVPTSINVAEVKPFNNNVVQVLNNNVFQHFNNNGGQAFRNNNVQSFKNSSVQTYTYKNINNAVQTYKNSALQAFSNGAVKMINNNKSAVQTVNNNDNHVVQTPVIKAPHLPVYSIPIIQVRTPQVLNPVKVTRNAPTFSSQPSVPYAKSSATSSVIQKVTPPILPKSKVSHVPAMRPKLPKKTVSVTPSSPSCYNCQKLARVLPYLAHSRRKLSMHSSSGEHGAVMVLVCEICGEVVRETVIFGDYIVLDHVSTAHFPSFLVNSQGQAGAVGQEGGSQNYIKMGEEWS